MVTKGLDLTTDEAEEWFRDSWKYCTHGVLLYNVCVSGQFDDITTFKERVLFSRYMSSLLKTFIRSGSHDVGITCVGLKSFSVGRAIVSSLGPHRSSVTVRLVESPGVVLRRNCDTESPDDTIELITATQAAATRLGKLIQELPYVSSEHFGVAMSNDANTHLMEESDDLLKVLNTLTNKIPSAESQIQPSELKEVIDSLKSAVASFTVALTASTAQMLAAAPPRSREQGTPAAFGRTPPGSRTTAAGRMHTTAGSVATSASRTSRVPRTTVLVDDDDDEPVTVSAQAASGSSHTSTSVSVNPTPSTTNTRSAANTLSTTGSNHGGRPVTHIALADDSDDDAPTPTATRAKHPAAPSHVSSATGGSILNQRRAPVTSERMKELADDLLTLGLCNDDKFEKTACDVIANNAAPPSEFATMIADINEYYVRNELRTPCTDMDSKHEDDIKAIVGRFYTDA